MTEESQSNPNATLRSFQDMFRPLGYAVNSLIANNGKTILLKAEQMQLQREVAIKILSIDQLKNQVSEKRFESESRLLGSFEHESIVKLYGTGKLPDCRSFMVMEYLHGKTIQALLQDGHKFTEEQVKQIGTQVCNALSYAHERKVIHRDVKPGNVMILSTMDSGKQLKIKLLDFGIYKSMEPIDQQLTQGEIAPGTTNYMSVEQCKGEELDQRADIYSLACLLYEMCTGNPPMQGNSDWVTMSNHLNKDRAALQFPPGFGASFRAVIIKCLSKNREDRFFSMKEVSSALRQEEQKQRSVLIGSVLAICVVASLILFIHHIQIDAQRSSASLNSVAHTQERWSVKQNWTDYSRSVLNKHAEPREQRKLAKDWFLYRIRSNRFDDEFFDILFADSALAFDQDMAEKTIAEIDKQMTNDSNTGISIVKLRLAKAMMLIELRKFDLAEKQCLEAAKGLGESNKPFEQNLHGILLACRDKEADKASTTNIFRAFFNNLKAPSSKADLLSAYSEYLYRMKEYNAERQKIIEATNYYLRSQDLRYHPARMLYVALRLGQMQKNDILEKLSKKYAAVSRDHVLLCFLACIAQKEDWDEVSKLLAGNYQNLFEKDVSKLESIKLLYYFKTHQQNDFDKLLNLVLSKISLGAESSVYQPALTMVCVIEPKILDIAIEKLQGKNNLFLAELIEGEAVYYREHGKYEKSLETFEKSQMYYERAFVASRKNYSYSAYTAYFGLIELFLERNRVADAKKVYEKCNAYWTANQDQYNSNYAKHLMSIYEGQLLRAEGSMTKAAEIHSDLIAQLNFDDPLERELYLVAQLQLLADYVRGKNKAKVNEWKNTILPKITSIGKDSEAYMKPIHDLFLENANN